MTEEAVRGIRMKAIDVGVILSLLMSITTLGFSAGILWNGQQQNTKDISDLKARSDGQALQLTRIDANVTFLADRAREDRENQERARR